MSEDPLALSKISAAPPAETDYEAICAAVMETDRGRWFLTEYARRNRHADTNVILSAIERIEAAIRGEEVSPDSNHLRLDLLDMAEVIARTEAEMAAIKPETGPRGNPDDAAQRQASTSAEVLAAAERVLDIVWTLRERDVDSELCDALHAAASELHAASEHQNFTALRADKAMQVLRHLEGRIIALIDVWGGRPSPAKDAANGAGATEHEAADIGVATADHTNSAAPEPEARHDEEPAAVVSEPLGLGLDLDPLMPAEVPREAETETDVEVETAASQPIEEANLIDEAAAMIAAASEAAAVSEPVVDREAEPEPAPEAPAEIETQISDPDAHPEPPPPVAANGPIVFAAARPHVFVVYQASETVADETPLDSPEAPPTEPPIETDVDAADAPAMLEPEPAVAMVDESVAADANIAAEPSIESPVAPPAEYAGLSEPEQPPSQADEAAADALDFAADEAAADAVVAAVAEAMAEAAVETETASNVAEIEAAHGATEHEKTDVAASAALEVEQAAVSEPVAHVLIEPEPPHGPDDHELDMSVQPTAAAEEQSVTAEAPTEDVYEAPAVALPDHDSEPPTVEIATEPENEIAAIESGVPAGLDTLPGQTTENPDAPPMGEATAPSAVDDIEFLLEPMPSLDAPAPEIAVPAPEPVALAPEVAAPAPEPVASAPEPAVPTPAAAALLPEPDEDPADLFEMLPEPQPAAAEIPAPPLSVLSAESELIDASLDAAIAASAAAIPEPTFAAPSPASVAVQAETPPSSAVAAPSAAPPSRVATRPILTQRVTPNDPMAAVRALSEDELIALFS